MKKVLLFYGHSPSNGDLAVFSNFYPCIFYDKDGLKYENSEQYMMKKKADTFGDLEAATEIMSNSDPRKIKSWGRKVKGYDDEIWTGAARQHVYEGCLLKFSQNQKLKGILLATGDSILAEASPTDCRWGIGMSMSDPFATNPEKWIGTNWLGEVLMRVREELRGEDEKMK